MDKFLEIYKLPKLKQEEIENRNRPITNKDTKSVIKNLPYEGNKASVQQPARKWAIPATTRALRSFPTESWDSENPRAKRPN